jgi:hypothetical protein
VSPSFGTRTSLGYEPYDVRLCCLGKSLVRSHTTHVSHGTLWGSEARLMAYRRDDKVLT